MNEAKHLKQGQKVVVQLVDDCFVGNFISVNEKLSRIELSNVHDFYSKDAISGIQIYYKSEVRTIKPFDSFDSIDDITNDNVEAIDEINKSPSSCNDSFSNEYISKVDALQQFIKDLVVVFQKDSTYYAAIEDIMRNDSIALNVEGAHRGRHSETSVISIATTTNRIYIFDIRSLGQIYIELKHVIEDDHILKIVHNAKLIGDNLKHRHNINLNNIFDTMVAHIACGNEKCAVTLLQCISLNLKIPEQLLLISNNTVDWYKRPLRMELKQLAGWNVIYLHTLHWHFLRNHFLKPLYAVCQQYANVLRDNDDTIQVARTICSDESFGTENVDLNNLDLNISIQDLN